MSAAYEPTPAGLRLGYTLAPAVTPLTTTTTNPNVHGTTWGTPSASLGKIQTQVKPRVT